MLDKIKSCLLGGMLGDAYGNRFSNMDVPTRDEKWRFSDASFLTIATCDSLVDTKTPRPKRIAEKFADYYKQGRLKGMTPSTLRSLILLSMGKDPSKSASNMNGSATDSAGAAMRIAPLAFLLDPHDPNTLKTIRDICNITDDGPEAFAGALAVMHAIRLVQNAQQNFIPQVIRLLPDSEVKNRLQEVSRDPEANIRKLLLQRERGDYAPETIPVALLAAQKIMTSSVMSVWRELVSSARDSAVMCAISGQIAGMVLEPEAFPDDWNKKMKAADDFEDFDIIIDRFSAVCHKKNRVQSLF